MSANIATYDFREDGMRGEIATSPTSLRPPVSPLTPLSSPSHLSSIEFAPLPAPRHPLTEAVRQIISLPTNPPPPPFQILIDTLEADARAELKILEDENKLITTLLEENLVRQKKARQKLDYAQSLRAHTSVANESVSISAVIFSDT